MIKRRKLDVDGDLIRQLADLLEETGLSEIEVRAGQQQVRVARHSHVNGSVAPLAAVPAPAETVPVVAETSAEPDASHPGAVCAPMVGTAYLAPEPGAAPYVSLGDQVAEGDTMFVIEAMKTLNPVRAPRAGKVGQILIQNAMPVEYGQVLALLE